MSDHVFDRGISVTQTESSEKSASYRCSISSEFSINGNPNGGYLAALGLRAAADYAANRGGGPVRLEAQVITVHFIAVARTGERADMTVDEEELASVKGKKMVLNVSLRQRGRLLSKFLITLAPKASNVQDRGRNNVDFSLKSEAPEGRNLWAPPGVVIPSAGGGGALPEGYDGKLIDVMEASRARFSRKRQRLYSIFRNVRLYVDSECPFLKQPPYLGVSETADESSGPTSRDDFSSSSSTPARYEGYCGFDKSRDLTDVESLLLLLDAFFPPILAKCPRAPWVPTTEITFHVWGAAEPGERYAYLRNETSVCQNGWLEQDGTLWCPASGRILARSRQLMRLYQPMPTRAKM